MRKEELKERGIRAVTAKGQTYYYLGRGGPRISGVPGTEEFETSYRKASRPPSGATGRTGYVYFLRAGERIKIGFSKNPFGRASQMSTGMSFDISAFSFVRGTEGDERGAHYCLREHRVSREWFSASPAVVKFMMNSIAFGRIVLPEGPHDEMDAELAEAEAEWSSVGRTRARTWDPMIKSHLLYQLSYAPGS